MPTFITSLIKGPVFLFTFFYKEVKIEQKLMTGRVMIQTFISDTGLNFDLIKVELTSIYDFMDLETFQKIINKLTDYGEILSTGKLSGIVNFRYSLNSAQTTRVIQFLVNTQTLSKIFTMARAISWARSS